MHDAGVKDHSGFMTSTNLDLLFFSRNKTQFPYKLRNFSKLYPETWPKNTHNEPDDHAFKRLMDMNLLPLAMKLMKNCKWGKKNNN